ncbi:MAG TPA: type II secretion system secretin GspD [Burkholderiales bacterium]|nr:type II secretion system secretin GspD [Burkholderiales bacterium]
MSGTPRTVQSRGRSRLGLAAATLALLVAGCSMLPPTMREGTPEAGEAPTAGPQATFGPSGPPPASAVASSAPRSVPKLFKGTGTFLNPAPPRPAGPAGPEEASLNFEALDVREVAKVILGDYLKQSYTVHPQVQGTVTFRTVKPIPMKDLLPTLEMLLRQNNATVVREDGIYKILPVNQVRGSITPQLGGSNLPIPPAFSVLVVPLKYVGAREMARILEPFAPPETIRVDEVRNLIIMAGDERELRHLVDTVELFDVDWLAGYSIGLFPIHSTDVKTLVGDLDKIFGSAAQSPLAGVVRVIPIERLNSLLVVTTQPKYLDMAKTWIERIDEAGTTSGGSRFYVYQVRNGKAENLAQLISDLFSTRRTTVSAPTLAPGSRPTELRSSTFGQTTPPAQSTSTTVTPAPSATFSLPGANGTTSNEVRVIADKDTNSLLILATPSDYETIENALRQLDVVPRQVLVEVMLAEVTLTDELRMGLEYYIHTRNNTSGSLNVGGLGTAGPTGPVPPFNGLQLINFAGGEVRAVLNALGTDGKARVLASPQIMVLDNQKAQIKVGDRISVQTQAQTGVSTGTGVLNSFQYLETGILLAVTPRINSGGLVTLDVNQEVSVPDPNSVSANNPNPTVNSRSAQTSVVVASGESIVLGGLIREDNTRSTSGIPLLSKIPVLGALFGTQGYRRQRTELVLIITPRIISDSSQAREATLELRKKLPALEGLLPKPKDLPIPANPPIPRGK